MVTPKASLAMRRRAQARKAEDEKRRIKTPAANAPPGDYCSRCNGTGVDPDLDDDAIGSCDVCGGTGAGKDERGE